MAASSCSTMGVLRLEQVRPVPAIDATAGQAGRSTTISRCGLHASATCSLGVGPWGLRASLSRRTAGAMIGNLNTAMARRIVIQDRGLGSSHVALGNSHLRPRRGRHLISIRAGEFSVIETDIDEEPRERYSTLGEEEREPFNFGTWDGHHTWHEGDDGTFFEGIKESLKKAGGPTGFQAVISWAYFPALCIMLAAGVEMMYALLMTAGFLVVFIILELQKPRKFFHIVKTPE